jgi:hypothetical protein
MSVKPLLVLTSDWHLSPFSWKKHPNVHRDSYYSLQQIVDLCIKLNVPLIAAGDLFDIKQPPSESVVFCFEQMKRLERVGLPVYYVQGQHELSEIPWMSLCSNAVHIDSFKTSQPFKEFEIQGLRVVGQDIEFSGNRFADQCRAMHSYAGKDRFDLYVTHQVWADFIKKSDENFMFKNAAFAKVIYTGDYHKTEILNIEGTECLSSGSINMQATNEPPHKLIFILNSDLSWTQYRLKTRPFALFELKSEKHFDILMGLTNDELLVEWPHKDLPQHIATPLVCVRYQNNIPNAYDLLCDKFRNWNYEIIPTDFNSSEVTAAVERKHIQELVDISECVEQTGFSESTVAHKDAVRVFNSSNVEQELLEMRNEHLQGVADVS